MKEETTGSGAGIDPMTKTDATAWLWDFDRRRIVWATPKAVAFWKEANLLDLLARDFGEEDASVLSFQQYRDDGREPGDCRFKLLPDQEILFAWCRAEYRPVATDRLGLYVEVLHVDERPNDPEFDPAIVLARSAPVALTLYDLNGRRIYENEAASQIFGPHIGSDLTSRVVGGKTATLIVHRTLADGMFSRTVRVHSRFGIRRYRLTARRSAHPRTGAPTVTLNWRDVEDSHNLWVDLTRVAQQAFPPTPDGAEEAAKEETVQAADTTPTVFALMNSLPWGVISFGRTGEIDFCNDKAVELLTGEVRAGPGHLNGGKFSSLLSHATQKRLEQALARSQKPALPGTLLNKQKARFRLNGRDSALDLTLIAVKEPDQVRYYAILTPPEAGGVNAPVFGGQDADQLRFVATLSHDMRTPLNAIIGFSEIMKDERLGPINNGRYKDYASDIHSSSAHLLTLVNDLLDFARFRSGQLTVTRKPTDLGPILKGAARLLEPECERTGVKILVDAAPNLPPVLVDPPLVERALLNILSNAVKFSPRGESVTLRAKTLQSGMAQVSVSDNGPGMSEEDIGQAMEPFHQASTAEKMSGERPHLRGSGLGLPLAKALVEANDGVFRLTSKVGTGTVAAFSLPAANADQ